MTFEEWLMTDEGKRCNDPYQWTVCQPYLKNRLYRAFEAGVVSAEHDERLYKTLQYYNETVKNLKAEIRALKKANKELQSVQGV